MFLLTSASIGPAYATKNLGRLFQAWNQIRGTIPEDVWLVVAGANGGSRIFSGRPMDVQPGGVFLAGHVDEDLLPALCAGAMAMAYPSVYEGFGLPPLEAMACGTPVLAGNRSSLPEVLDDAGLMVDPFNVEAVAEGLYRLVKDSALRDDLRRKGLLRAKRFSWDETAFRTWEVLKAATP